MFVFFEKVRSKFVYWKTISDPKAMLQPWTGISDPKALLQPPVKHFQSNALPEPLLEELKSRSYKGGAEKICLIPQQKHIHPR